MGKVEIWLVALMKLSCVLKTTTGYPEWRSSEGYSIGWELKDSKGYSLRTRQFYSPKYEVIRWDTFDGTSRAFWSVKEQELHYYFPQTDETDTVVMSCYQISTMNLSKKGWKLLHFPDLSDYARERSVLVNENILEQWSYGLDAKVIVEYRDGRTDEPILIRTILDDKNTTFSNFKRGTPPDSVFARPMIPCEAIEDEKDVYQLTTLVISHMYGYGYIFTNLEEPTRRKFTGYRKQKRLYGLGSALPSKYSDEEIDERLKSLPPKLDWRSRGFNATIRDQGECGSCWAFAAVSAIEAAFFMNTGRHVQLSEQALMDCSWFNGNRGCFGGESANAFEWLKTHRGIPKTVNYRPYLRENGRCNIPQKPQNTIKGYVRVTNKYNTDYENENRVKVALYDHGPLVTAMTATTEFLEFNYSQGKVLTPTEGWNEEKDHEVVIVGYGTISGDTYWIIRNSWGKGWGDEGYAYVLANKNAFSLLDDVYYVIV